MDSNVIDFKIYSIELLSTYRSVSQDLLVTFEVSLTPSEDVDMIEKLSQIFSQIEYYQMDSIVVIDQYSYTKEG